MVVYGKQKSKSDIFFSDKQSRNTGAEK